jgi:hypothetical protein
MGHSLEEIDLIFRESPSVWATARFAKNRPMEAMPNLPRDTREKGEVEHK